jgi:hypothetical protein
MKKMNFHIAYLLTKHECLIIPGFGAFIASSTEIDPAKERGLMCFPVQSLGFNPEIRHNDGLLANSLCKEESISYQTACLEIRSYVNLLNNRLAERKTVHIHWVGRLSLSEDRKIVFAPSSRLSCNANYFGLYPFYMPSLKDLELPFEHPLPEKKEKSEWIFISINKGMLRRAGWAAAVLAALFLVATPVNERSAGYSQEANVIPFSSKINITFSASSETPEGEEVEEANSVQILPIVAEEERAAEAVPVETVAEKKTVSRYYYIVVASLPTPALAKKALNDFQKSLFPATQIVSEGDKHRIYVRRFENKQEAETYLFQFRTQYPQHKDAWLLSQRENNR